MPPAPRHATGYISVHYSCVARTVQSKRTGNLFSSVQLTSYQSLKSLKISNAHLSFPSFSLSSVSLLLSLPFVTVPPRSFHGPPVPPLSFLPLPPLRSKPPEIQLGSLESGVSSPSRAWGGAAAEVKSDAF